MDRRGFLTGAFKGITAGGILIATSDTNLEAFARSTKIDEQIVAEPRPDIDLGLVVYNHMGQPIGVISQIESSLGQHNVTRMSDAYPQYQRGLMTTTMTVIKTGPVYIKGHAL